MVRLAGPFGLLLILAGTLAAAPGGPGGIGRATIGAVPDAAAFLAVGLGLLSVGLRQRRR